MIKLMYITNNPDVALIAEAAGVNRIFVDMEYIGKADRQRGLDTVQNAHTVADVANVRKVLTKAELMVRVNKIHEESAAEIDAVIAAGADIVMLPYFQNAEQVAAFLSYVNGRARTLLLFETLESIKNIDKILALPGIDECFIGLNDLHLESQMTFMFQLLADGTVAKTCEVFHRAGIPYGFGGIASIGQGLLHSEMVIREHYRLGSTCAILSRSFCNANKMTELEMIDEKFTNGIKNIRALEIECEKKLIDGDAEYFEDNRRNVVKTVDDICRAMETKRV